MKSNKGDITQVKCKMGLW